MTMRNAASCPFQVWDCHMAKYSPATTRKPKNQRPKPTVKPATAKTLARLKRSAGALSRVSNASAPTASRRQVNALDRDDRCVSDRPDTLVGDGATHQGIVGERRVHAQDVAHEFVVRVVVHDIVVSDDEGKSRERGDHRDLGKPEQHHGAHPAMKIVRVMGIPLEIASSVPMARGGKLSSRGLDCQRGLPDADGPPLAPRYFVNVSLFVCEGIRRFGVGVGIAVDVVVAVAQHYPAVEYEPSKFISRNR